MDEIRERICKYGDLRLIKAHVSSLEASSSPFCEPPVRPRHPHVRRQEVRWARGLHPSLQDCSAVQVLKQFVNPSRQDTSFFEKSQSGASKEHRYTLANSGFLGLTRIWEWRQERWPFQMLLSGGKTTINNKSSKWVFAPISRMASLIHQILQACVSRPTWIVISALKFEFNDKRRRSVEKFSCHLFKKFDEQIEKQTTEYIFTGETAACYYFHGICTTWSAKWRHWNFRQNCEEMDFRKPTALVIPGLRVLKPL